MDFPSPEALDLAHPWRAHQAVAWVVLAALLFAAVVADLRTRRIPNRLVAAGALSAMAQQALLPLGPHPAVGPLYGSPGVLMGGMAAALMLAIGVLLWRVGLWGAGDAKWLAVLAGHAGPDWVWPLLCWTLLAGGVLALVWKLASRPNPMPYALSIRP
ncbi:MAG: prepilin peptidase [Betaproteobacteria bacterium]